MHARVTTLTGAAMEVDAGIANFRANVAPFLRDAGAGVMLLVDRDAGKALAITLWPDLESLTASEERANALRASAAADMGAATPAVDRYEVAFYEV